VKHGRAVKPDGTRFASLVRRAVRPAGCSAGRWAGS